MKYKSCDIGLRLNGNTSRYEWNDERMNKQPNTQTNPISNDYSARVSASVPSGVGFLGAGLMIQDIHKDLGVISLTVKGLNTAASVWLSAAVGVACGGGLYFSATFTTALMLVLLRFGPRATMDRADSVLGMSLPYRSSAPWRGKDVTTNTRW